METIIHMLPVIEIDDERFYALCQLNRDVRLERNPDGDVIFMPPTGGDTGWRNAEITVQLGLWARQDATGTIFDSSTGFRLPNNAVRSASKICAASKKYSTPFLGDRRPANPTRQCSGGMPSSARSPEFLSGRNAARSTPLYTVCTRSGGHPTATKARRIKSAQQMSALPRRGKTRQYTCRAQTGKRKGYSCR